MEDFKVSFYFVKLIVDLHFEEWNSKNLSACQMEFILNMHNVW